MIRMPGISRWDDTGVIADAREFRHDEFADEHRARGVQPADDGGVLDWNAITKNFRTTGGP